MKNKMRLLFVCLLALALPFRGAAADDIFKIKAREKAEEAIQHSLTELKRRQQEFTTKSKLLVTSSDSTPLKTFQLLQNAYYQTEKAEEALVQQVTFLDALIVELANEVEPEKRESLKRRRAELVGSCNFTRLQNYRNYLLAFDRVELLEPGGWNSPVTLEKARVVRSCLNYIKQNLEKWKESSFKKGEYVFQELAAISTKLEDHRSNFAFDLLKTFLGHIQCN